MNNLREKLLHRNSSNNQLLNTDKRNMFMEQSMTTNSMKFNQSHFLELSTRIGMDQNKISNENSQIYLHNDEGISSFRIFMMIIKGYCAMVILILPKSFENGGYIASPATLIISGFASTVCALKLAQVGVKTGIYDFSEVGGLAMGRIGKITIDLMLCFTYFTFLTSNMTFVYENAKDLYEHYFSRDDSVFVAGFLITIVYFFLIQQLDLKKFSFAFVLGSTILLIVCVKMIIYCMVIISKEGVGEDIKAIDSNNFWGALGFSIYVYEGIGCIMPILKISKNPKQFYRMLIYAVTALVITYTVFGVICYLAFGNKLTEPIVLQMLPSDNILTIFIKIIFCLQLLCSYPLYSTLVTNIAESYIFHPRFVKQYDYRRVLFRGLQVIIGVVMAIIFAKKLDKFFSVLGALLCAPIVFILPTLCHLYLVAETKAEILTDKAIIVVAFFIQIFCTYQALLSWDS
ncbi:UNKNOWN [Stylonychia lemnae]|uniref:Amino acid transporter transmembrane domain-containing protein n=1 Tax=Stylonychia lemnae TaxID=5949 RepID=A0A078AW80_STYLE|nr:UNKNOWN [Stylonychia lemnae]|eukprot:CDW86725.1 UNKNOWN [Stylonychia lemnae]